MDQSWCFEHYLSYRSLMSADNVRAQLRRVMERNDLELVSVPFDDPQYYNNIRRSLTCGFFMQAAKKAQGQRHYVTVKDQQVVSLHPSTVLETTPEWVIYNEFVLTSKNFIRTVTNIRPEWLLELAPAYYDLEDTKAFPKNSEVRIGLTGVVNRINRAKELAKRKAALNGRA